MYALFFTFILVAVVQKLLKLIHIWQRYSKSNYYTFLCIGAKVYFSTVLKSSVYLLLSDSLLVSATDVYTNHISHRENRYPLIVQKQQN